MPELTELQTDCLRIIGERDSSNPISYQDISVVLGVHPRKVRQAVEDLVMVHHQPICSSYNPKLPGYYWPQTREEIAETCGRLIKHGVSIINRAKAIGKYSQEEVFGQVRMEMERV